METRPHFCNHYSINSSHFGCKICEVNILEFRMLLIPGTGHGERGTGNRERESGNKCSAVTRLRIQNSGQNDVFKH